MEYQELCQSTCTNPFPGYHEKERVKYLQAMLKELDRRKQEKEAA
jgi:hypothetical protein